jgi:hypothetical protein
LTAEQRKRVIELLAERWLENMSGRDLERFFLDLQIEYLEEYTDKELLGDLEDNMTDEEYEEIFNEIG